MGKIKATLTDSTATTAVAAGTPISSGAATDAAAAAPAIIVFGRDEANKAHASWFAAAEAELAVKAAGFMGLRVLPVTTDEHRAAATQLAAGRIFESGKGFVPFCREAAYKALEAFEGAYAPPVPAEPDPEPVVAVSGVPRSWAELAVGSLVLASAGEEEGWWPSLIVEARGENLFVIRWQGFEDEPSFVRRGEDLGLMPPSAKSTEAAAEPAGESGEAPAAP